MPRFWYTSDESEDRQRCLEANNLPAALLNLKEHGVKVKSGGQYRTPLPLTPRVKEQLLIPVYEQLASLLDQGVELRVSPCAAWPPRLPVTAWAAA